MKMTAMRLSSAFQSDAQSGIIAEAQPKRRREGRKSMSRRSGQSGNLVKQSGWWRVRFRLDQSGTEKRKQMSLPIAMVGMRPYRPAQERPSKARVDNAGANSEERFNRVVSGETTFREQAKTYLQKA